MNRSTSGPPDAPEHPADVIDRWRATSLAEVWLRPDDWYHPAVDALVEALHEGRSPHAAAHRLGAARGRAGVGLGETLDDVECLYRAAQRDPDPEAIRAVSVGWVRGRDAEPTLGAVRDPGTGLPTREYLAERLRETYGAAVGADRDVPTTHCLVVVDVAVDGLAPWDRAARSATVGRALEQVFGEGHPMAALTDGVFAVLALRETGVPDLAKATRSVVERNAALMGLADALRRPTRVWVERLPTSHGAAVELLSQLAR
ncbi:hypothetical protein SAMN04324258_0846 [Krasilnikoviella flava]|uniref:GGDEF domain-containing protein, diguanylate cyclase (C-di-GMP synthetase) or its enzymatically inactive variants n=2 Tax=Krasilnikoviella flava TaxID=526729 RepID=A0A1T5IRP3_9MICO|nr:hypothetical protein SAMN04324258_0846 [Krasilnikoviella flava]